MRRRSFKDGHHEGLDKTEVRDQYKHTYGAPIVAKSKPLKVKRRSLRKERNE